MFSLHKLQKFLLKHIFLVSSISQINRLLFLFLLIASPCSDCITNKYKCICKRGKSFQETFYFYFLWVNNASTSFFTHFHSINFIYTAYFAKNYFIFTSYMKYFYLWRVSIVTGHCQTSQTGLIVTSNSFILIEGDQDGGQIKRNQNIDWTEPDRKWKIRLRYLSTCVLFPLPPCVPYDSVDTCVALLISWQRWWPGRVKLPRHTPWHRHTGLVNQPPRPPRHRTQPPDEVTSRK